MIRRHAAAPRLCLLALFLVAPACGEPAADPIVPTPDAAPAQAVDAAVTDASPAPSDAAPGAIETNLGGAPPALSNDAEVVFIFSSSPPGASFTCALDGEPIAPCTSPLVLAPAEGAHVFSVAALSDPTPAVIPFTIDRTPPETSIFAGPSGATITTGASFTFAASEEATTFECRLDGGAWTACSSGQSYAALAPGAHLFTVRATDAAGNADPTPEERSWAVVGSGTGATIVSGPPALGNMNDVTFTIVAADAGATLECSLDGGAFAPCVSPVFHIDLPDGTHTFAARTVGPLGTDPVPAERTFAIDTVAPAVSIVAGPAASAVTGAEVSFSLASDDPQATFECRMDAGSFAPCASPRGYTLGDGAHLFEARARDAAGNTSAEPAVRVFAVKTGGPPSVIVLSPAKGALTGGAGAITFVGTEAGMTFTCSLDGAPPVACLSPFPFTFTGDATHTFVLAGAGTLGAATPVEVAWRADAVAPGVTIAAPASDGAVTCPQDAVSFTSELEATFSCSLEGAGALVPCAAALPGPFAPGAHTVWVRAHDPAGNVSPLASRTFTVDAAGPTVTFQAPAATTGPSEIAVAFTSSEAGAFSCAVLDGDGATLATFACAPGPGVTIPISLATGTYMVRVTGSDAACGNGSLSERTFTVDADAPTLEVTGPAGPIASASGTVTFTANGAETFTCSIVDAGGKIVLATAPHACPPAGFPYSGLPDGVYRAVVTAFDAHGNAAKDTSDFAIDTTGPDADVACELLKEPGAIVCKLGAPGAVSFTCALDGGRPAPCESPVLYEELGLGEHEVTVVAHDGLGNAGTPAVATVKISYGTGHVVWIGHDLATHDDAVARIVANAVRLSHAPEAGKKLDILVWTSKTVEDNDLEGFTKALEANDVEHALREFVDVEELAGELLSPPDVLVLPDQGAFEAKYDVSLKKVGTAWSSDLKAYLALGGVVVVLDGLGEQTKAPTAMIGVLAGAGLLDLPGAPLPLDEGQPITVAKGGPLAEGVPEKGYLSVASTVALPEGTITAPGGGKVTVVFAHDAQPVVLHTER